MRYSGRYSRLFIFTLFLGLSPLASAFPFDWTFNILPAQDIFGAPGQTAGFGYEIENLDETNWLVTSFLDAGSFLNATPFLIFDFPILAPLESTVLPYNPALHIGLYEITWDPTAPIGFVNSGVFTLTVDFFDGDPFQGGQLLSPGWILEVPYSVTVKPIPEPSTYSYLIAALLVVSGWRGVSRKGPKRIE